MKKEIKIIGESIVDIYEFYKSEKYDDFLVPICDKIETKQVAGGAAHFAKCLFNIINRNNYKIKFYTNEYYDRSYCATDILNIVKNEDEFEIINSGYDKKNIIIKRIYINNKLFLRIDKGKNVDRKEDLIYNLIDNIKKDDIIIISNYHKGFLTDSDISNIILKCNINKAIICIDTKKLNFNYLEASLIKINEKTARDFLEKNIFNYSKVLSKYFKSNVVVTLGEKGFNCCDSIIYKQSKNRTLKSYIDSIGAGDVFFAHLIKNFCLENRTLYESCIEANKYAKKSCQKIGTI